MPCAILAGGLKGPRQEGDKPRRDDHKGQTRESSSAGDSDGMAISATLQLQCTSWPGSILRGGMMYRILVITYQLTQTRPTIQSTLQRCTAAPLMDTNWKQIHNSGVFLTCALTSQMSSLSCVQRHVLSVKPNCQDSEKPSTPRIAGLRPPPPPPSLDVSFVVLPGAMR